MGDIIVVRPRSALGRRIECERAGGAADTGAPDDGLGRGEELDHTRIVDLGRIVSPYAAETEKNLRTLFERAQKADHVLVFDESDELFGRRGDADPCVTLTADEFEALVRSRRQAS